MQDRPLGCVHAAPRSPQDRVELVPFSDEPEGASLPSREATAGEVIDGHVHLFPPRVFEAIWRWFDRNAWRIRYRMQAEQVVEFLASRGVTKMIALHYSHAPGMARELNRFVHELGRAHRDAIVPFGTVLPGEPDARAVVREALGPLGLFGIKLHCHVQKMAADDPRLDEVFEECQAARKPVVIHSGREPSSPAYGVDTRALCAADQVDRVLARFPKLTVVVPHLGADEFVEYEALLAKHENLFLDTTGVFGGLVPTGVAAGVVARNPTRVLYGTDFPNLPYAWDREIRRLVELPLSTEARRALFRENAERVFLSS